MNPVLRAKRFTPLPLRTRAYVGIFAAAMLMLLRRTAAERGEQSQPKQP